MQSKVLFGEYTFLIQEENKPTVADPKYHYQCNCHATKIYNLLVVKAIQISAYE